VVSVTSKTDALSVLENIETVFKGPENGWKGGFAENVTVSAISVNIDTLATTQAAVEYLLTGSTKEDVYEVVDGDTIWDICVRFNISPEEIEVANPDLDPDNIFVGDELKLKRFEPFVHYEASGVITTREPVAFETVEEPTEDLYEGESEVAQEGVLGERDVTRKETRVNGQTITSEELTSTAITAPVSRIVRVGTKVKPQSVASTPSSSTAPKPDYSSSYQNGAGIVATAYAYIGVPYVWGGSSPSGFDCSGLVQYVYAMNGISIPRTGVDMAAVGRVFPLSEAVPGDVLGWGGPGPGCYHVALYIGNNQYIHAPYPGASVSVATFGWFYPDYAIRL
jgi:cell wall-associated NlpC family hydrolase